MLVKVTSLVVVALWLVLQPAAAQIETRTIWRVYACDLDISPQPVCFFITGDAVFNSQENCEAWVAMQAGRVAQRKYTCVYKEIPYSPWRRP